MEKRIYNFSAGPSVLPEEVLLEVQKDLFSFKGQGLSVMEMSHRSKTFDEIIKSAESDLRKLLNISDEYAVLFLQGGATLQFSMVPLNLMPPKNKADYINTGAWSQKAIKEAKRVGEVNVAGSSEESNFNFIPKQSALNLSPDAAYVHMTSNNTIFGTEFKTEPETGNVPLVCDASSDILSRTLDINKYGLIYAGAQKNMGPAGAALVIVKKSLLTEVPAEVHTYLNYNIHVEKDSLYNTPPSFTIYVMGLVYKWLLEKGGLGEMQKINESKAKMLYDAIDESDGYYVGSAAVEDRSLMNVTFNLKNEELEKKMIAEATEKGFSGLKGHRSVGGLRASIYNAFPTKGVEDLVKFMKEFKSAN